MREVSVEEAATRFSQLLDEVERGEVLAIVKDGQRSARIIPESVARQEEIRSAVGSIIELRKRQGRVTVEEIRSALNEGRRP